MLSEEATYTLNSTVMNTELYQLDLKPRSVNIMKTLFEDRYQVDEEFQELKRWLCSTPFWPIQISDSSSHSRSTLQTTGWEWFWLKPRIETRYVGVENWGHIPGYVQIDWQRLLWGLRFCRETVLSMTYMGDQHWQRARKVIARALHTRRFDTENCTATETSGLVDYQRFTSSHHNNNPLVVIHVTTIQSVENVRKQGEPLLDA